MRFYFGTPGWGWRMYGIGYKTAWFLGLSIKDSGVIPTHTAAQAATTKD